MNIQANLSNVSLIPTSKKPVSKVSAAHEDLDQKQAKGNKQSTQLAANNVERAEILQQIESLNDSQKTNFRFSDIENKNQKSIQSYIDNQALESQELRDELRDQLGIDLSV